MSRMNDRGVADILSRAILIPKKLPLSERAGPIFCGSGFRILSSTRSETALRSLENPGTVSRSPDGVKRSISRRSFRKTFSGRNACRRRIRFLRFPRILRVAKGKKVSGALNLTTL